MAAPRRLVGRIVRLAMRGAAVAGAIALVRDRLIKRNDERHGLDPLEQH